MKGTVVATHGTYVGEKCPACKAVLQANRNETAAKVLRAHWKICHPGPMPKTPGAGEPAPQPAPGPDNRLF